MRDTVHPVSVGFWENPNPGSDGTTTSNESSASPPNETGSADVFAQHLPAGILSQVAYGAVFAIADSDLSNGTLGARAATITSLLMLGVPETRAIALVGDQP
jgi:hypothetical protein